MRHYDNKHFHCQCQSEVKIPMNTEKNRHRAKNVCGVIYPDDPNFPGYLNFIKQYTYFYINHDRSIDEDGNKKKPHIHFLLRFPNAVSLPGLTKAMNIPDNYLQTCTDSKSYIRYLVHADDPEKEQYKVSEIKSNDYLFLSKCFDDISYEKFLTKFLLYISSRPGHDQIYLADVVTWALNNGWYDQYFRNYKVIRDIIYQENERRLTRYNVPLQEYTEISENEELPF